MRMAHRLVNHGAQAFDILAAGSWTYVYNKTNVTWNTTIAYDPVYSYRPVAPTLNSDGDHVFYTDYQSNRISCARSEVVDISKYRRMRIKYKNWINSVPGRCHIELQSADDPRAAVDYRPYPNATAIDITHDTTNTPGEIVVDITNAAKTSPNRYVWVKVLRASGDGSVYSQITITSITFE